MEKKFEIKESPFHQQIVLPEGMSYSTVELLEGTALPKREPQIVKIEGTLEAPLKWLEKRADTINERECHIIVDREKMSIALHIDETNYFETTITGKTVLSSRIPQIRYQFRSISYTSRNGRIFQNEP